MNADTGGGPARWRRWPRWAGMLAAVAGLALMASGCGGGGTPAGSGASPSATSLSARQLAFSRCMRSHGVPKFPDPSSNGLKVNGNALGVSPAVQQAAMQACRKLLPGGPRSGQNSAQNAAQALKFAQCLRKHGEPGMPDPNGDGSFTITGSSGINVQSPAFQKAQKACQSVMPPQLSIGTSTRAGS